MFDESCIPTTLILPGNPIFDETLVTAKPPGWENYAASKGDGEYVAFVADAGSGLLRPANWQELQEYSYGGELDALESARDDRSE
jgi:hypothetical protein